MISKDYKNAYISNTFNKTRRITVHDENNFKNRNKK